MIEQIQSSYTHTEAGLQLRRMTLMSKNNNEGIESRCMVNKQVRDYNQFYKLEPFTNSTYYIHECCRKLWPALPLHLTVVCSNLEHLFQGSGL